MRLALALSCLLPLLPACSGTWKDCGCSEDRQICIAEGSDAPMSEFDVDTSWCEDLPAGCDGSFPEDGGGSNMTDDCLLALCDCTSEELCSYTTEFDGFGGWFFSCSAAE